jgi:hypothetical protein
MPLPVALTTLLKDAEEMDETVFPPRGAMHESYKVIGDCPPRRRNYHRWTPAEIRRLRRLFRNHTDRELAVTFKVTVSSIRNASHVFNLKKDPAYKREMNHRLGMALVATPASIAHRYPKGHVPANAGLRRPGWAPGRMAETQFKKGSRSGAAARKWCPVGTLKMRDGYLIMKVKDEPEAIAGKGAHSTNWMFVHKMVWEQAHGPQPPGHRIWWKDGNHWNCDLANLELVADKDHMARTTIHRLPEDLKQVIRLTAAIRSTITKRLKRERGIANGQESTVRSA